MRAVGFSAMPLDAHTRFGVSRVVVLDIVIALRLIYTRLPKTSFLHMLVSLDPWPLHKPPWQCQIRGAQRREKCDILRICDCQTMGFEDAHGQQHLVSNARFLCWRTIFKSIAPRLIIHMNLKASDCQTWIQAGRVIPTRGL